jgi:biotin-dependent carboxylase-like uncharacterized protein
VSALEILRIAGIATVQDGGRPGHMHEGVPPGGPLVPEHFWAANAAVGNPPDAPVVELVLGKMTVRAIGGGISLGTEAGDVVVLAPGAEHEVTVSSSLRVAYLAVEGGVSVPPALGGRGTLAVAGLGGFEGRGLRRGDRLAIGDAPRVARRKTSAPPALDQPVRVIAGPDQGRFASAALDVLTSSTFTILPSSDRVGTRLGGPPLPRRDDDDALSAPMVAGAIEVPGSGPPIVLGPDHPTTGGYPVLAVVIRVDRGRFAARPIGGTVRFVAVSLAEARGATAR